MNVEKAKQHLTEVAVEALAQYSHQLEQDDDPQAEQKVSTYAETLRGWLSHHVDLIEAIAAPKVLH